VKIYALNNEVKKLYDAGDLDGAERKLDEIERLLAARPTGAVTATTLDAANDEWFYLSHRIHVGWSRGAYEATLEQARRMYELERAIFEAKGPAYATGAWALISFLTRCGRYEEAEKVFSDFTRDDDFLYERRERNQGFVEKVFTAGLCAHFENPDPANYRRGHAAVQRAQDKGTKDPQLSYSYGLFWSRAGKIEKAIQTFDSAVRAGYDLEALVADPALDPALREHSWFEGGFVDRVYPWKIKSQPSGARIYMDGVDTGKVTPARFRAPSVGKHTIKLVLVDHLDHEWSTVQEGKNNGLDWTAQLTSVATQRAREEAALDGTRVPDDAAREKTVAFIGKRKRARVTVQRDTTYGLGGLTIVVSGDGHVEFQKLGWGKEPNRKHSQRITDDDVARIFDALVAQAFSEMNVGSNPGYPDEIFISIKLEGAGGTYTQGKFGSSPHPRFDMLVAAIVSTVAARVDEPTRKLLTL
jgi:tetratricopeptide (TPR) repeat protein